MSETRDAHRLRTVKIVHTAAWAFFASCVVGILPAAWAMQFKLAVILISAVAVEVVILAANAWRCPLTGVAAQYTDDRQDNFDIYLPLLVARYNKEIFGTLYVAGVLYTLVRWFSAHE